MGNSVSVRTGRLVIALEWNENGVSKAIITGVEKSALKKDGISPLISKPKLPDFVVDACCKIAGYGQKSYDIRGVAVDDSVLTLFQRRVFRKLATIPAGKAASYSWLARGVGDPRAVRAVARALARNPLPLVYPCHRVVGKDRMLHGFSAWGGVETKRYLLDLEGVSWEPDGTVSRSCMID